MWQHWEFLCAEVAERQAFSSLESTLALPGEPAGLPNRFREVRRIATASGTYYLKIFHRTQTKNRLRFAITRPRARSDAQREALITEALRQRGIETPRPVALGHRGPRSFYLCAEMRGRTLLNLLQRGHCTPELAGSFARFCGGILRAGVILPDLSAHHVYLLEDGVRLGVLDLHNGYLSARVPRRAATRVLKHFRRSVRGLALPRRPALAFATRLLKAAGLGCQSAAILSRIPPLDSHGRYESRRRAAAYRDRNPLRTARELDLIRRVWPGLPGELVLDAPCGLGRLTPLLRDELGVRLVSADRSWAMLSGTKTTGQKVPKRESQPHLTVQSDNLALPFGDRSLEGMVLFRFLHHLPPRLARDALNEASRVARRYVVVSFFHPVSIHGVRRRLVELFGSRARKRHALRLGTIRAWMAADGYRLHRFGAERPYLRDFWVASFVRP